MIVKTQELRIQGIPISRGIAIGTPYFLSHVEETIFEIAILPENINVEKSSVTDRH